MSSTRDPARNVLPSWIARGAGFLGFWLILAGSSPADFAVGVLTAAIATWASLHLLPSGEWSLRPAALARFGLRFLLQSVAAGIDVAWRALHPRLPLHAGFVTYQPRLAPGLTRNAFCTETSLVPGTLPAGTAENGALVIHCLDVDQPVVAQLTVEEELLAQALGAWPNHG
jgi:multicomponent Na+:H+ antiporter subunit E